MLHHRHPAANTSSRQARTYTRRQPHPFTCAISACRAYCQDYACDSTLRPMTLDGNYCSCLRATCITRGMFAYYLQCMCWGVHLDCHPLNQLACRTHDRAAGSRSDLQLRTLTSLPVRLTRDVQTPPFDLRTPACTDDSVGPVQVAILTLGSGLSRPSVPFASRPRFTSRDTSPS